MMDHQHRSWLVFILLPLMWTTSWRQVDGARPLQTHMSQKSSWPWYSMLPPVCQPLLAGPTLPNLLNFTLPLPSTGGVVPPPPPPSPPPFSFPKLALPPFTAPKFPSLPPLSQPGFSFPPFSQPKPTLPSIPPTSFPWSNPTPPQSTLPTTPSFPWSNPTPPLPTVPTTPSFPWTIPSPPLPATPSFPWSNPTPPLPTAPTTPSFPWTTPSPPPPATPSFPWSNPTPSLPTIPTTPSFPWTTPSPPPLATPSFPWTNPTPPLPTVPSFPWNTPSPPPPATPSFPWTNPSPSPPLLTIPTIPKIPNVPIIPTIPSIPINPTIPSIPTIPTNPSIPNISSIPSLPWNTPSPPPAFPWLSSPPAALPTLPGLIPSPAIPKDLIGSTLPPFGIPPGGPLLPDGIKFTFSNFTNSWLPSAGVKVTWESVISIELSLQLLVDAVVKPITLIIQQFSDLGSGPGSWGWKNGLTGSKLSANVGATCTTLGENGLPEKGLILVQTPIEHTVDTAVTWFTVLFHGWSKETPFNATLDHTPGTFGGFVTNVTAPNLKSLCSHPESLSRVAAKQGQYVLG